RTRSPLRRMCIANSPLACRNCGGVLTGRDESTSEGSAKGRAGRGGKRTASRAALRAGREPCDCRAEMRPGIVPEFHDVGVSIERLLDNAALNAAAAAVHQPQLVETR